LILLTLRVTAERHQATGMKSDEIGILAI
jgi:hypothetical protein